MEQPPDPVQEVLEKRFGLTYLFPYQRLVIANILAAAQDETSHHDEAATLGRQIVILPTGAGKSLCFQLPAALLSRPTLVIYPLLSLLNDQARRISEGGFSVVQLQGGQPARTRRSLLQKLRDGTVDFVITNPETLQNRDVFDAMREAQIIHAVIDEAHCISEWGDTFRPVYLEVGNALARLGVPLVTAFTATAGEKVLGRIRETVFGPSGAHLIRGNPDRENIHYSVIPCLSRPHAVARLFGGTGSSVQLPAIVFCRTRAETMMYAARVGSVLGMDRALYYHAGLERDEKVRIENRFFSSADGVLCATCAYGMGVDKPNIRTVIHTYLPETAEAFLQESGRAGRDRNQAISIVLSDPREARRYREATAPTVVQQMVFGSGCRRDPLLRAMGTEPESCTGCDRCDPATGDGSRLGPGESETVLHIRNAVQQRPGEYTPVEWVRLFRGVASWQDRCRGMHRTPGFATMTQWPSADLQEGLEQLLELGMLDLRRGRLTATQARRGFPHAFRKPRKEPGSSPQRRPQMSAGNQPGRD